MNEFEGFEKPPPTQARKSVHPRGHTRVTSTGGPPGQGGGHIQPPFLKVMQLFSAQPLVVFRHVYTPPYNI
jgi:hypothetical protein